MRDIATATLTGNLTRGFELRPLPSGTEVARLRVAKGTRRRSGEEWVERTASQLWFARLPVTGSYWVDVLPGFVVVAIGLGLALVSVGIAALPACVIATPAWHPA